MKKSKGQFSEKIKDLFKQKKVIVIVIGVLILVGVLVSIKAFYLNSPKENPKEITQNIIDYAQKNKPTDAEKANIRKYYTSNLVDEFSKDVSDTKSSGEDSKNNVIFSITNEQISKNTATTTVELSAWIIKIPIQFKFTKEGNFWKGYKWMVNDIAGINSSESKKESTAKAGDKIDIGGGFTLTISQLSDFIPSDSWSQADDGMKFVFLEMTYSNGSDKSESANPSNLTLRDSEDHSYDTTYRATKTPELKSGTVVTAGGSAKGFVVYEIPQSAKITKAVYSNPAATITISF